MVGNRSVEVETLRKFTNQDNLVPGETIVTKSHFPSMKTNMWGLISSFWFHTHNHSTYHIKDTRQSVDPALYGFQHASLRGHVLLGRHGDTTDKEREISWGVQHVVAIIGAVKCIWLTVSLHSIALGWNVSGPTAVLANGKEVCVCVSSSSVSPVLASSSVSGIVFSSVRKNHFADWRNLKVPFQY